MAGLERRGEIPLTINRAVLQGRELQIGGRWPLAVEHLSGVLRELRLGETAVLNERGLNNRMVGDYDAAEADFRQARTIARKTNDLDGEVTALVGLIDLARTGEWAKKYKRGKDLGQATVWRVRTENILRRMPEGWNLTKINAFTQFGLLDHELGDDRQAIEMYSEAEKGCKDLLRRQPDDKNLQNRLMRILTNKGVAQTALGQFEEAITTQNEALEGYRNLEDLRGVVNCEVALARLYVQTGDPLAVKWYEQAIKSSQREESGKVVVVDELMNKLAKEELASLNPQ